MHKDKARVLVFPPWYFPCLQPFETQGLPGLDMFSMDLITLTGFFFELLLPEPLLTLSTNLSVAGNSTAQLHLLWDCQFLVLEKTMKQPLSTHPFLCTSDFIYSMSFQSSLASYIMLLLLIESSFQLYEHP